jgi:hypothetical protein
VFDEAKGIMGFVDQFAAALKWGLRIDTASWTGASSTAPLPLLVQLAQKKGHAALEGSLKVLHCAMICSV